MRRLTGPGRGRSHGHALTLTALIALVGCAGLREPFGDEIVQGRRVRVESVTLDPDGAAITLTFVGAAEFERGNPCTSDYRGKASEDGDGTLLVEVVEANPPGHLDDEASCDLVGHFRHVTVSLDPPFAGFRVRDIGGGVFFVRRPDGLWGLGRLPDGWVLQRQSDVPLSPAASWSRIYAPDLAAADDPATRLELIQAFDGPPDVGGLEDVEAAQVGTARALLYRGRSSGELALAWMAGGHGFGLLANTATFSADELIEIAESLRPSPDP